MILNLFIHIFMLIHKYQIIHKLLNTLVLHTFFQYLLIFFKFIYNLHFQIFTMYE